MLNLIGKPRAVAGLPLDEDGAFFLHESLCGEFHLHLLDRNSPRRPEAEAYIAEAYQRVFSSRLGCFFPSLVALHDREHRVLGVAGARWASSQRLFVEHYLETRIERAIAVHAGPVCRDQVIEIGNMAIGNAASVYLFFALIGECLCGYDVQWMVFSLTSPLRRMLVRAGVPLLELASADARRAPRDGNQWGRYYELDPRVCAVPAEEGLARFRASYQRLHGQVRLGQDRR